MALGVDQVGGDRIYLQRSDARHLAGTRQAPVARNTSDFGQMLMDELAKVNEAQQKSMQISQQMITDPESVDPHDVTVALAEANLSLNIAKSVVDRVIRAYREITTMR